MREREKRVVGRRSIIDVPRRRAGPQHDHGHSPLYSQLSRGLWHGHGRVSLKSTSGPVAHVLSADLKRSRHLPPPSATRPARATASWRTNTVLPGGGGGAVVLPGIARTERLGPVVAAD